MAEAKRPPLPEPARITPIRFGDDGHWYSAEQMHDYAAAARQIALAEAAQWQPIETAPKDRMAPVLLWVPMWRKKLAEALPLCGYWMDSYWVVVNADAAVQRVEPTHWMPLPPPPAIRKLGVT